MFTTQDDADFGEGEEVLERPVPIRGSDPLTLRLLMRVDDLPESAFMHVGTLEDARAKAEEMAAG